MSLVKLILNPALMLFDTGETASLVSEKELFELPIACFPLLKQLQSPTEVDEISVADRPYLRRLGELRLLNNANFNGLPAETATYWLAQGYYPSFVKAQLALSIQFIGPFAEKYSIAFSSRYPECDVVDSEGKLIVYATDDVLNCQIPDDIKSPVLILKVDGLKQSIGPTLSPNFRYADLRARISRPIQANFSIKVPAAVQETADHLLMTELYHYRVIGGKHLASNHLVEWDLSDMTKKCWEVKPL